MQYMDEYGINNVRGGSFVSIKLKKSIIETLKQMSNGTNNKCFVCGKKGHFANNCLENEYCESDSDEYCESDSDEYCEVWSCSYCGKDFDTYKGAIFHQNVHCKNNEYGFQTNKKSLNCYRCGRKGHYSSDCYASTHIKGYYLN